MSELNTLLNDDQIERFIADGFLIVQSDVDKALHARVERRLREVDAAESWHGNNILPRIPELHEVLQCSVVRGALVSLLGEDYLLHPHRAVHRSVPLDEAVGVDVEADGTPMGKGSTAASVWHQDAQVHWLVQGIAYPDSLLVFTFPTILRWLWGQHACKQEAIFGQVRNQPPWALSCQIMLRREPLCWCTSIWFMRDFRIVRTTIDSC